MPSPNGGRQPIFLVGRIVDLRPLSRADIPLITRWINDAEVRDFVSCAFPKTERQEEEWLNKLDVDDHNIVLGIALKNGRLIGLMGAHGIEWHNRICTTGALIGEKRYWGKGYGTDAKMILLEYLFNTLNMHKVCSGVIAYNKRSLRYSLHCGYKIEGVRKQHIFKRGRYWDLIELGLFRNAWLPIWERYRETGRIR